MATSNPLGPHFSPTLLYSAGSEPFIIPLISMTNSSASHGVDHVSEVFVVETHSVGKKIIGNLRNRFTITSQTQRGDFYLDQSRVLLQKHAHIINAEDQDIILDTFTEANESKRKMETSNSRVKRYFKAIEYMRLSRETFELVVGASNRAVEEDNLMHQMVEALGGDPPSQPTSESLQPTHNNPLTNSHEVLSVLSGVAVSNLTSMDMETYQSEVTGDGAFVLELHMQDASTQYIAATFSPTVFSNNSADADIHSMTTVTESIIFGDQRCQ
ncbi:hypothetical protein DFH94DRAFT_769774 [Russula ochroleuca]|uniref:Uncharacterized protein n=1 Tax=Russula ochroleuca TaxID=152965 RepID=A0A9P5MPJ1_9AGAM|nr:hypothetical protein DFH94DRAFT_769774 [Russula ochroleuca]